MKARRLIPILVCILTGVSAASAQNYTDPAQVQQEIERLQRLLELQQPQQQTGQQPQGASQTAPSQYQRPQQQQSGQPVVLQPFDTGRSVVTFNLGDQGRGNRNRPAATITTPGRFQIKTNLLYVGTTLSPNLSFEFGL
ncbi:MAG: DUF3575 domain-containing protein, partial [Alistipes sp.]|nr:DUF3575 domain-containing protein [Alistipes sp.]